MRLGTRVLRLWLGLIFVWSACLFVWCLFLVDTGQCLSEEDCELQQTPGRGRLLRFLEHYDDIPEADDVVVDVVAFGGKTPLILEWTLPGDTIKSVQDGATKRVTCPEVTCVLTQNKSRFQEADAMVIHGHSVQAGVELPRGRQRPPGQLWVLALADPLTFLHTDNDLSVVNNVINWTCSHSYLADVPLPYGFYQKHDVVQLPATQPTDSDGFMTKMKRRMVAWFAENCDRNSAHWKLVAEVQRFLPVDVFGPCGERSCGSREMCLKMLKSNYKFLLAFENAKCPYITPTFWFTALEHNVIPIVMEPSREVYAHVTPPHSFIHVSDYATPRDLAKYISTVDNDDALFRSYFLWKEKGSVEFITQAHSDVLWCSVCEALYDRNIPRDKVYSDLDSWAEKQTCPKSS